LRSANFLDVENYPEITFTGGSLRIISQNDFLLTGDLTIRGVTHEVTLEVQYLGKWDTSYWEDGVDKGPITRAGFVAKTKINRRDFGVSWNDTMDIGGIVVGVVAMLIATIFALSAVRQRKADATVIEDNF
jgi:polyisoprenoid-binding protein YceI